MKTRTPSVSSPNMLVQGNGHFLAIGNAANLSAGSSFRKLFLDLLKDIYWAEQHFAGTLQKMYDAATTGILQRTFKDIQHITSRHVTRLERVFALLGKSPEAKKCETMEALIKEADKVIEETPEHSVIRDASLIASAQKMEHYGIATYNSLVHAALALGHDEAAHILENILREEEHSDIQLADVAENGIHPSEDLQDELEEGHI